jgi:hypothetical protein
MAKTKEPPLADWHVRLGDASFTESLTIRATSATVIDGAVYLRDIRGGILFTAPLNVVRYVRRAEPGGDLSGEHVPAAPQTRGGYRGGSPASEVAPPSRVPSGTLAASPEPAKPIEPIALEPKQARPSRRTAK